MVCDVYDAEALREPRGAAPRPRSSSTRSPASRSASTRRTTTCAADQPGPHRGHPQPDRRRAGGRRPPPDRRERRLPLRAGGGLGQGRGGPHRHRRAAGISATAMRGARRPRAPGPRADGIEGTSSATAGSTGRGPTSTATAPRPRKRDRRRLPIVGKGTGTFSFVHVEDAAGATVAALDRAETGHLQRRSTTSPRRCASGCRSTPRRSAPSRRAGCRPGSPARGRLGRRPPARRAARRLQREGEARARLAAAPPELAPGLPRGARPALPRISTVSRPRRRQGRPCSASCASTRW